MRPTTYYVQKVDEALALVDVPPNNRYYQIEEAAHWAQLALLALQIGPCCDEHAPKEPTDAT